MCWINWCIKILDKQKLGALINDMNQAIVHRWPDDQGSFCQSNDKFTIGQGQVRLAIIDLTDAWFQPMFYDKNVGGFSQKHHPEILEEIGEESVRIVFNGEIYNYQEIRWDLINKWYNFSSNSDTEVILASYLEYGADCVNHFNGMRAFAIYNPNIQEMFCSRDRLGKKPFYYYFDAEQFIFSSELKGILEHKELQINTKENIDSEALDFYFTMGYIPAPWTIYKNVKKLEARHNLLITLENWKLSLNTICYYDIPKYIPINDKKALIDEGKKLLEESVKIRMFTSDVPVGAFLSGWLDSSSVVAEMTKRIDKTNLNTFSIWFEGKQYDESYYIHIVENSFWTKHHHEYFQQKDFDRMLQDISFYYDEPFADSSAFPTRFVSELARKDVTVCLSGDGGDEIFGGYMMHQVAAQMTIIRYIPKFIRQFIYYIIPKINNNTSIVFKIKEAFRLSLLPLNHFYSNLWWSVLYKPIIYKKRTEEKLSQLLKATHGNFTQAIIDFDLFYNTLSDNFLVKVDRASLAQPIEVRSPFLDYRFIDYSRKIPTKWKTTWQWTKIIMREIIKDIVPEVIINRKKQWFKPPIDAWILDNKYTLEIEQWLEELHINWVIDTNWYVFFLENVLKKENSIFNEKRISLFLFILWYKRWVK